MDQAGNTIDRAVSDRSGNIRAWQMTAQHGNESAVSTAIIAALFDSLIAFLQTILHQAKKEDAVPSYLAPLLDNMAALHFWGLDFGVSQGDLDMALQYSHRLRDTVLIILVSVGDLLSRGIVNVLPSQERENLLQRSKIRPLTEDARGLLDEQSDAPQYSGEDTLGLFQTLGNMIDSLRLLRSSLESVIDEDIDDGQAQSYMSVQDRSAYEYYVDLISQRFPSVSSKLAQELGKANWDRYKYVSRLGENVQREIEVAETKKPQSEFYDSGIGSSAPPETVVDNDDLPVIHNHQPDCAATIISSRADASHKRLPPLSDEARSGIPFECEICHRTLQIRRTKDWKIHVFDDIRAYTCILPGCTATRISLTDREALKNHLTSHHSITEDSGPQDCPLCLDEINGGRDIISLHFARHMEEIALSVLPQSAESEDGSEASEESDEKASLDFVAEQNSQSAEETHKLPKVQDIPENFENARPESPNKSSSSVNIRGLNHSLDQEILPKEPLMALSDSHTKEPQAYSSFDPELQSYLTNLTNGPTKDSFAYASMTHSIVCICGSTSSGIDDIMCSVCQSLQHRICYYGNSAAAGIHICNNCKYSPGVNSAQASVPLSGDRYLRGLHDHALSAPTPTIRNASETPFDEQNPPVFMTRASDPWPNSIRKAPYMRPQRPKIMCPQCNERPDGFRGPHELERHVKRAHSATRSGYICIDASSDKKFLANCKHCRDKKVYDACYYAAAHLRSAHFHPRERGRKSAKERGGIGGADDPPMDYLKRHWMREVQVDRLGALRDVQNLETEPEALHEDHNLEAEPDIISDKQFPCVRCGAPDPAFCNCSLEFPKAYQELSLGPEYVFDPTYTGAESTYMPESASMIALPGSASHSLRSNLPNVDDILAHSPYSKDVCMSRPPFSAIYQPDDFNTVAQEISQGDQKILEQRQTEHQPPVNTIDQVPPESDRSFNSSHAFDTSPAGFGSSLGNLGASQSPWNAKSSTRPQLGSLSNNSSPPFGIVLPNKTFTCTSVSCSNLKFGRLADLRRHHRTIHAPTLYAQYYCRVEGCNRSNLDERMEKLDEKGKLSGIEKFTIVRRGVGFGMRKDKRDEHERVVHALEDDTSDPEPVPLSLTTVAQDRLASENSIGFLHMDKTLACGDVSCRGSRFGRLADLQRHYDQQHKKSVKEYFCRFDGCSRAEGSSPSKGFGTRKDKRDEHERRQHEVADADISDQAVDWSKETSVH
ncbi:unnamed protein product [Periconia digitata]|uniref:C2H2-type domain-containing protein n=1 Tax=Periconia digitata TaxID=1303443 RepID=A0A9W4UUY6_9PLEO|nr:unnamed protein product [Periconia digitata]